MGEEVKVDKWGYEVNTSSDACISAINAYYHQLLIYGRERSVILEAPLRDQHCVLANILAAHFLCSADPSRAPLHIQAAKSRLQQASAYEKAVFDAVSCLISQDRDDDLALELHSKVLHENQNENYIYGMLAFSLLECGQMVDAEKAAKRGFEINKQDCWSQHALCHVLQYECRFKEAVEFMEECSSSWSLCSSFMLTHNWWHVSLCYLEGHSSIRKVLEVYDNYIWKELERPDAASAEVYLNALGLLLRVYVRGHAVVFEDRLKTLVSRLTDQSTWYIEWHLDLLTIWALASTGELVKTEALLQGLKSRLSRMSKKKQQTMQRGILLAEALYEYGRGNHIRALELLGPDFNANHCKMIGASDEQLDVFNELWYSMLLSTGQATKAIEVIEKQVKNREGVPFLWRLLERGYSMTGKQEARVAGEKAMALETSYFK
ncbi:uncharacterized protein LOC100262208 isoform X2 [Vitis vinifera]|uniref:uncharacterized protein LOC100262208 isoform X2 n=1 Tax=Vitis vinifera TaxID=29760 RepID=UPI0008FEB4D3|nr:uncharacterized protein LOC100262208 isoform X2 [Vitis vinifera]|eukprot:XP_019076247.1 PREDICTED: tetratricopeptide repeat protein 38 isoform X2 [Vitis vinifera]